PTYNQLLSLTKSEVVVNDPGRNVDFRVESDNNPNMLFVDASTDRVGIGTSAPAYTLDVEGDIQAHAYHTGDIFFQKSGKDIWRMFEDENGLYVENLETGKVYRFVLEDAENNDIAVKGMDTSFNGTPWIMLGFMGAIGALLMLYWKKRDEL
ncbi:MAG: hypothetical protein J7K95_01475, partial [Thermoplasmata archaeon]|nr:hypothetical protein [Thermoplasmata archaeon]